jgi:hypothetical protein
MAVVSLEGAVDDLEEIVDYIAARNPPHEGARRARPLMPACPILTPRRQRRYFLFAAAAAPGFALAIASGTLPAVAGAFFLSAFGFFTSRLLLF